MASGDPRPSVEERYKSFRHYDRKVVRAIKHMVKERLMLCEDADSEHQRLIQAGLDHGVPPPDAQTAVQPLPPICRAKKHGDDDDDGEDD